MSGAFLGELFVSLHPECKEGLNSALKAQTDGAIWRPIGKILSDDFPQFANDIPYLLSLQSGERMLTALKEKKPLPENRKAPVVDATVVQRLAEAICLVSHVLEDTTREQLSTFADALMDNAILKEDISEWTEEVVYKLKVLLRKKVEAEEFLEITIASCYLENKIGKFQYYKEIKEALELLEKRN